MSRSVAVGDGCGAHPTSSRATAGRPGRDAQAQPGQPSSPTPGRRPRATPRASSVQIRFSSLWWPSAWRFSSRSTAARSKVEPTNRSVPREPVPGRVEVPCGTRRPAEPGSRPSGGRRRRPGGNAARPLSATTSTPRVAPWSRPAGRTRTPRAGGRAGVGGAPGDAAILEGGRVLPPLRRCRAQGGARVRGQLVVEDRAPECPAPTPMPCGSTRSWSPTRTAFKAATSQHRGVSGDRRRHELQTAGAQDERASPIDSTTSPRGRRTDSNTTRDSS